MSIAVLSLLVSIKILNLRLIEVKTNFIYVYHDAWYGVQTFFEPLNVLPPTVIHVKHVNGAFKCKFGTNSR